MNASVPPKATIDKLNAADPIIRMLQNTEIKLNYNITKHEHYRILHNVPVRIVDYFPDIIQNDVQFLSVTISKDLGVN